MIFSHIIKSETGLTVSKEHKFHPTRKWRFDFANPSKKIAIEFEGGIWIHGGHVRGSGIIRDTEKYNEAQILGWKVLRYTSSTLNNIAGDLLRLI